VPGIRTRDDMVAALHDRLVVPLPAAVWEALAPLFPESERHATGIAGDLIVVRTPLGPAVVEAPAEDERIIRLLGDAANARRFVDERLAQYERMWEGCGCRIDYLAGGTREEPVGP
jgi:hypothetical protein